MNRSSQGQFLLEILIAVTLVMLVLVAAVRVSIHSVKNVRVAGDQLEASKLAEEKLAEIIEDKERSIESFFETGFVSYDCGPLGEVEEYDCQVYFTGADADSVEVTIEVSWEEGGSILDVSVSRLLVRGLW